MENIMFDLKQMQVQDLTFDELMTIEGGINWHIIGIILGIATVVASAITLITLLGPAAALMAFI